MIESGVKSPITVSGNIVFGNIIASCYSHSEEHAKKLQDIADCFDWYKLINIIGKDMTQNLVDEMYNKLANKTFRKDRIIKPLSNTITV